MIQAGFTTKPLYKMDFIQRLKGAVFVSLITLPLIAACDTSVSTDDGMYKFQNPGNGGIGKVYMGREISHVMGHLGADWLERQGREAEERTDLLIANLPIKKNSTIADIGAGTGYFALPMAKLAKSGRVYAVDIQPEMLEMLTTRAEMANIDNIIPVKATETNPNLPLASIDMVLLVDAYHEFEFPREVMQNLYSSLKPGGQLVLIEYRGEDPSIRIKRLHKMTEKQSIAELEATGLVWQQTLDILPQQHFMIFMRPN